MKMIRKMIKSSLIKKLLKNNPHLVQKDVESIVNIVLDGISNALSKKGRAEIRGFGTFSLRHRNARNGRNVSSRRSRIFERDGRLFRTATRRYS